MKKMAHPLDERGGLNRQDTIDYLGANNTYFDAARRKQPPSHLLLQASKSAVQCDLGTGDFQNEPE